jgi:serine/threonine protein kinase
MRFYRALSDLPNVPPLIGKVGETGFAHAFAPGTPLSKDRPIPDSFFNELHQLMEELHRRNIAYVDTNKPQNILHGEDDHPHLIDFQISYDLVDLWNTPINRWILRRMQREDFYHLLKHKKSLRPDLMSPEEIAQSEKRSWIIKVHRAIATPFRKIRRRTLKRLRDSGQLLPEGSK